MFIQHLSFDKNGLAIAAATLLPRPLRKLTALAKITAMVMMR